MSAKALSDAWTLIKDNSAADPAQSRVILERRLAALD